MISSFFYYLCNGVDDNSVAIATAKLSKILI